MIFSPVVRMIFIIITFVILSVMQTVVQYFPFFMEYQPHFLLAMSFSLSLFIPGYQAILCSLILGFFYGSLVGDALAFYINLFIISNLVLMTLNQYLFRYEKSTPGIIYWIALLFFYFIVIFTRMQNIVSLKSYIINFLIDGINTLVIVKWSLFIFRSKDYLDNLMYRLQ